MGKVWESVLGCVKKVWKSKGSGKIWDRCGKVFWVWRKVKRGVGKCVGVWGR